MPATATDRRTPAAESPPRLLRGSLVTLRRKCGKPSCRCASGGLHENPALSYSLAGRTKILALRAEDVAVVEAALARYQAAQQRLEAEAMTGVAQLTALLAARRSGRARR